MDHKEQHHEKHQHDREEKKKEQKEHEKKSEKEGGGPAIHPAWFWAIGVGAVLVAVLVWTFAWS